jgi:hypothetical protein
VPGILRVSKDEIGRDSSAICPERLTVEPKGRGIEGSWSEGTPGQAPFCFCKVLVNRTPTPMKVAMAIPYLMRLFIFYTIQRVLEYFNDTVKLCSNFLDPI